MKCEKHQTELDKVNEIYTCIRCDTENKPNPITNKNYYIFGQFDRNDKELVRAINEMAETGTSNTKCKNTQCKHHQSYEENLCTLLMDATDCEFWEIIEPELSLYNKKTIKQRGN